MPEFNWTCPFCNHAQTVSSTKYHRKAHYIDAGQHKHDKLGYVFTAIACSNTDCKEITTSITLNSVTIDSYRDVQKIGEKIAHFRLTPDSFAKPQPDYIPQPIRDDYLEACKVRDLSPKASATLSRRCLQGMIRDFCKISKNRLVDEISTLKEMVDTGAAPAGVSPDSIDAIDALRKIGNIGAHMEKDIDVIVDVDPNEAQALIELIESLFDEWYVARHKRQQRFAKVAQVATQKDADKASAQPSK